MQEIPTGTYEVLPSAYQVVKVAGTIQIKDCCDNNNNNNNNNNKDEKHHDMNYYGGHERATKSRQTRSATRGRALSIDIQTSAGVSIVDERTYTFEWNKEEEEEEAAAITKNNGGRGVNKATTTTMEDGTITMLRNGTDTDNDNNNGRSNNNSTNQTRIGTLTLDDNVFGSQKRTTLEPVRYDEERQTLTVKALWTGKVPWFGGSSYSVHVPIRTVLRKQKSTTKQSEEERKNKVMFPSTLPSPVLLSSSSSTSPSSSPSPLPLPLPLPSLVVQTEPALSLSRYQVFDAYIRRTSEQCAF